MDEDRDSGFSEEEIERYLRAPETLSDEDHRRLARLLASSEEAQRIAEMLERFYSELSTSLDDPAPDLEDLIHELFAAGSIVRLFPITDDPALEEREAEMPSTLMAAATEEVASGEPRLKSSSYGSVEGSLLVRILHDSRSGSSRVFVLTDEPGTEAFTVVTFPAVALHVATDVHGQAVFRPPRSLLETAWDRMETLVRFPLATYQLPGTADTAPELPDHARGDELGDYVLEFDRSGEDIRLVARAAHSRMKSASLVTISRTDEATAVFELRRAEVLIAGDSIRGGDEIRLYA